MKPHARIAFGQILRNLATINSRTLVRKAELAASLVRLCPHRQQRLRTIEERAQAQLQLIAGLSFGTAVAAD